MGVGVPSNELGWVLSRAHSVCLVCMWVQRNVLSWSGGRESSSLFTAEQLFDERDRSKSVCQS